MDVYAYTPVCMCMKSKTLTNLNKKTRFCIETFPKLTSEGKCDFTLKHRMRLGHLGWACFDESSAILFSSKRDVPNVSCLLSYPVEPHFAA